MTYSELRQLVHNMAFYGTRPEFSEAAEYAESANRLNEQIERYLSPDAPVFDNEALGEVLDTLSTMRRALSATKDGQPRLVDETSERLGDIENLFSQVDVTKGRTLADCVDDIMPRTVQVGEKMDQMGGQASSRNLLKRPAAGGQEISGFFTEEVSLFEVNPVLADAFYTAKNAHKGDDAFREFCERVEASPYGLRSLTFCLYPGFSDNNVENPKHPGDNPGIAYYPERLSSFGLITLPEGNGRIYDQFDLFLQEPKNENIREFLKDYRERVSDKFIETAGKENDRYGVSEGNGLKAMAGSSMTGRNVAMSRVANLLGISSIVARSAPIAVEQNGVTTRGVFMEKAEGLDFPKNSDDLPATPFFDLPRDAFDGAGLKSAADLQILDYICQNVDRHQNNMLYSFDQNHKLVTVMGIDHDMAFGTTVCADDETLQNGTSLDNLGVISESCANAVRRMTPEMLTNALADTGLKREEITAACDRLEKLRTRLALAETIAAEGKAEAGKLKIVPEDAWKDMKRRSLSLSEGNRNIFAVVGIVDSIVREKQAEVAKSGKKPAKKAAEEKHFAGSSSVDELDPNRLRGYQQSIAELNDTLKTTEGLFHGSNQQYKNMREALDRFAQLRIPAGSPDEPEQRAYYDALSEVNHAVNAYVTYKTERADTGRTAETRLETARQLQKLVAPHLESYREAMHAKQEAELAKVDQELREEQRKFDAIVESLTDSVCTATQTDDRVRVKNTIRNGGTLKNMARDNEELDHLYKLSQEKPGELYKTYIRALSYAAAVATARNREPAPAPQAANRQAGRNSNVLPGGKVK